MRKLVMALLALFVSVSVSAQLIKPRAKTINNTRTADMSKYLAGAVPEVNGMVTFSKRIAVSGKSATQLYDGVYGFISTLTKGSNMLDGTIINKADKQSGTIIAHIAEPLVFKNTDFVIDYTDLRYCFTATCANGQVSVRVDSIVYDYEKGRPTYIHATAEEWINDKNGLNKKKTKLNRISGKFRTKTIDRFDALFADIEKKLK